MIEHCMIDGQRCSKCCEVLTIYESAKFREWGTYVRKFGYPDDYPTQNRIFHLVKKISKRRAKKINPQLVKNVRNKQAYFLCKNFSGNGCKDYENRPYMCYDYPHYGRSQKDWEESDEFKNGGLYRDDCTYFISLSEDDV